MPYPKKGEKKESYISRCIRMVRGEGTAQEAAVGKCMGMWRSHGKAKKAIKEGKALEVRG